MTETQTEIELIKEDILFVCNYGALKKPYNIPEEIKHAYNRTLFDLGNAVGWKDYSELIIDDALLIKKLAQALDIYKVARSNLGLIHSDEVINLLPDVLILESIFNDKFTTECAASVIFSILTIIRLIEFHKYISQLPSLDYFEESHGNLLLICNAQTQLLAAQDAVNKSQLYLFKSKYPIEHKIANDELNLYFTVEQGKEAKAKGGRKSQYDEIYEWSIKKASEIWKDEIKSNKEITRIGAMAESLKSEYVKQNESDKAAAVINIGLLKDKIRFLAKSIAPDALKGGRPKKTPL